MPCGSARGRRRRPRGERLGGVAPPPTAWAIPTAPTVRATTMAAARAMRVEGSGAEASHGEGPCAGEEAVVRAVSDNSLRARVKREPRTVTEPPWRSAIARTIARPRPEPSPPLAPEALERAGGVARARALVLDADRRAPSRSTVTVIRRRRPVAARVADQVADARARAPALAVDDARPATITSASTSAAAAARASSARSTGSPRTGAAASSRASASRSSSSAAQPRRVGLDVGQRPRDRRRAGRRRRRCRAGRSAACAARARHRRRSGARPRGRARARRAWR